MLFFALDVYMPKRTILISILWMLISAALFYAILTLVLFFNLFSWKFKLGTPVYVALTVILVLIFTNIILAKRTLGKVEIWVSLIVALALMVFGFYVMYGFYSEVVNNGFLSRSVLSPHWFRLLIFTLYLTPIICWLIYPYKLVKRSATMLK